MGDLSIDQCPIWWWEWGVVGDLSIDHYPIWWWEWGVVGDLSIDHHNYGGGSGVWWVICP